MSDTARYELQSFKQFLQQLQDGSELATRLGQHILRRLAATPLFISAALPRTIYPPKFNRYAGGEMFGTHRHAFFVGAGGILTDQGIQHYLGSSSM